MKKIVLILTAAFAIFEAKAQTKNFIDQPYIEVNGNADTAVTPDEIYLRIVISERDTKDRISVEEQEIKMVSALQSLGINTETDLSASDVGSNFRYYLLRSKDILKTKQYFLKVNDAVTATKVIGQLEDLDISNTSIDHVDYSGMEELKNIIKTKAVGNAKSRALALVKPLNQSLGNAIYIGETANNNLNYTPGVLSEVVVTGYGVARKQNIDLPKIDFKKIEIETSVNVKFILK